jgi:hypothetical protein
VPVYPTVRTIPKTDAVAKAALEQLFAGPTGEEKAKGFYSDFSDATKSLLISVNIKNRADPSHFYDWIRIGECPNELKNCESSNFIK